MQNDLPAYELYAIRYARRDANRSEHFIGGDPHDGPMPMDYFVWLARCGDHNVVIDTGFTKPVATRRLAKQVAFLTGRFALHAPYWQLVIWTRQLALFLVALAATIYRATSSSSLSSSSTNAAYNDGPRYGLAVADARRLPLADESVDLAVAGWALSYLKAEHEEWYADGSYGGAWRDEVDAALGELDRALGDGGVAVIFETQGTATAAPRRGGSHLYAHLRDRGFSESCVRTDYSFSTPAAALETLTFFFGKGVEKL